MIPTTHVYCIIFGNGLQAEPLFRLAVNRALDKPRICRQIYITFKQIPKMAVTDNYIGSGMYEMICSDINLPKYTRKEKRVLTPEEKEAMAAADFTDREKAFLFIIYYCGLRRGEALACPYPIFLLKRINLPSQ